MDCVIVFTTAAIVALYALIVHRFLPKTWYFWRPVVSKSPDRNEV
jgi:hypothetical protein